MKRMIFILVLLAVANISRANKVDSINYAPFGRITVYHPQSAPTSVALFVSGDGGWELGVRDMAQIVCNNGALVLGIDAKSYKKSVAKQSTGCWYPAADFENLSLMIQKKYKFPEYLKPILVGYSYGATLIYGILAQAPANTFKGAIALGFCPDIDLSKPLCKGTALTFHPMKGKISTYYLERTMGLSAPFTALNGFKDENCVYAATQQFLKGMPMAQLISLPKVGHGFSVNANWVPQFSKAYESIRNASSFAKMKSDQNALLKSQNLAPLAAQLPLTLVPTALKNDMPLVLFVSGDGGWTSFDHELSETLAKQGMPVVGLDAQKYFWNEKTPEQTTADITKALSHYMQQWDKKTFVLMGFSFGASVVPFVAGRLPNAQKNNLLAVISLSPDEQADFEIHVADMLNIGKNTGQYQVLPEIIKTKSLNPLCIFGKDEENDLESKLLKQGIKTVVVPGGHHYNNAYQVLTKTIIEHLPK